MIEGDIVSALALKGRPRQFVTRLHRWSGLTLLVFLFIAGVTGAVLSFRWELDAWLNPELFRVSPTASMRSQAEIIQHVEARFPGARVSVLTFPGAADESLRVALKWTMESPVTHKSALRANQVFVDPHTGAILGQRNTSEFVMSRANLIPVLLRLHYSLLLEKWGMWVMGGCAVVWFMTSLLGVALSWPGGWRRLRSWVGVVAIRRGQGTYKFNYDLHRAAGLLSFPVLMVVAFTAVYLNLPDVVKPVVQQFSPITGPVAAPTAGRVAPDQLVLPPEQAARVAVEQLPGGWIHSIGRDVGKGLYTVRVCLPTDVSPSGNNTVYVSMTDGTPVLVRRGADRTGADTFLAWQFPLHSGQAFGLTGQVLICMSAIALTGMCLTGLCVWLRKHRGERQLAARRRKAALATTAKAGELGKPASVST